MTNTDRQFDIILWGATGFTGQLVAEYLYKQYGADSDQLSWAIAGRNASKLAQIAEQIAGNDADKISQLIADADDDTSLENLVTQARVICTTVGPYAKYGEALVKACIHAGTHYCDLTGEVQWMAEMIHKYQLQAEESGARIVHTCGFDSIPSDMGVYYLQKMMREKHDSKAVEAKFRLKKASGGMSGGTVASMMNMMEEMKVNPEIKDVLADPYALNPDNMPRGDDNNDAMGAEYDRHFKQWTAPFVMAGINTRVVRRSNALMDYAYGRDFRYSEAILIGAGPTGYLKASLMAAATLAGMLTSMTAIGRSLINRVVPKPGEGPSEAAREAGFFQIEILGINASDSAKNITVSITGDKDPGYGSTSKMLAESAICLAKDELSIGGGFWTPAAAMGDKLLCRLEGNAGMSFSLVK